MKFILNDAIDPAVKLPYATFLDPEQIIPPISEVFRLNSKLSVGLT